MLWLIYSFRVIVNNWPTWRSPARKWNVGWQLFRLLQEINHAHHLSPQMKYSPILFTLLRVFTTCQVSSRSASHDPVGWGCGGWAHHPHIRAAQHDRYRYRLKSDDGLWIGRWYIVHRWSDNIHIYLRQVIDIIVDDTTKTIAAIEI